MPDPVTHDFLSTTGASGSRRMKTPPLWLLALITLSGTLAMHIFVPALPAAAQEMDTSPATMQAAISLYITGLAVGQLIYGPFSDRFGRKPVLTVGLSLYTLAGFLAAFAPTVPLLLTARLLQALGGCAGLVLARAIVRDTSTTNEVARKLALMNLMVVIGPGLAPLVGTFMTHIFGWRSVLLAMALMGAFNLFLTRTHLPETDGPSRRGSGASVLHDYVALLRSPTFFLCALGGGCATTSMYAFVAAAPFIFANELHQPPSATGWALVALLAGIWLGNMLLSRIAARVAGTTIMVRANLLSLLGASGFLALAMSGHLSALPIMFCMMIFTIGAGLTSPAAMTEAISINPHVAGSASGLYGSAQMGIGALCTTLAAGPGHSTALGVAIVLVTATLISQFALRRAAVLCRRRRGSIPA
ncbi:multidrug effflux MFS transporter [Acetobacter estunensis]|nr:multidrug effflux MFS transporter [Acetobacter estunensis]